MIQYLLSIGIFFSAQTMSPAQNSFEQQQRISLNGMKSTITENLNSGGIIVLDNGTKWAVDPNDIQFTGGWLGPVKVIIRKGPHADAHFPKMMLNKATGKIVNVRRIE